MPTDRRRIEDLAHRFAECWNRHDMGEFGRLFAEDAEFVNVVGLWWRGREEIEKAHRTTHATMFRNSELIIEEVAVRFVKPDVAVARSLWGLTGHRSPSGEALPPRSGILMTLVVKRNDHWEILDAQNTDIIADVLAPPQ